MNESILKKGWSNFYLAKIYSKLKVHLKVKEGKKIVERSVLISGKE